MSTVSITLMSVLIVMEAFSIATHIYLFRKKRKSIKKNTEITKAIHDEFEQYSAIMKQEIAALREELRQKA